MGPDMHEEPPLVLNTLQKDDVADMAQVKKQMLLIQRQQEGDPLEAALKANPIFFGDQLIQRHEEAKEEEEDLFNFEVVPQVVSEMPEDLAKDSYYQQ